ncbi:unnamed protein product [Parnassius mnemosyne]|uniref:Uncharacterized protein n=1 Tax=Parnassius mnemosyne TaxID=213953 RepID=A0AAV1K4B4_9NEOP
MYNPELAKTIVDKLTPTLRYRYYDFSAMQPREDPCFIKIEKFFKSEAELCGPYVLSEEMTPPPTAAPQRKIQKINNVTEKTYIPRCVVCEDTGHTNATECEQFKKLDANARWDMAKKSKHLCFRSLHYRNKTHHCRPKSCNVNSCKYSHHKMLHYEKKSEDTEAKENQGATEVINSTWTVKKQSYLKILPIQMDDGEYNHLRYDYT